MFRSLLAVAAIAADPANTPGCPGAVLEHTGIHDSAAAIGSQPADNITECCNICHNTLKCTGWTFNTKDGQKECFLKDNPDPKDAVACETCTTSFGATSPSTPTSPTPPLTPTPLTPPPSPPTPFVCDSARTQRCTHFIFVLQDDLGWNDIGFHNPSMQPVTPNITSLAKEGVVLDNHLVHFHCSPTRRSFISGRLPIHHGEGLSAVASDDVDLRWALISDKLKQAGYKSHWVGKGHTGYMSMAHLPTRRGFDSFTGYLSGAQKYYSNDRWHNEGPFNETTYTSILYGQTSVDIINSHASGPPLFLYLAWQAVHSPYACGPSPLDKDQCDAPAAAAQGREMYESVYQNMLQEADLWTGRVVDALKARAMWGDTLLVYCSDNGGVSWGGFDPKTHEHEPKGLAGINFPLRGEKHSNWAGGYRVAAFVSGGLVPESLRGSTSQLRVHVVDWYVTFCTMAGHGDCSDDPLSPPLPVDPSDPSKDIYGNNSYPGLDGVNVWPFLSQSQSTGAGAGAGAGADDIYAAHATLVVSEQVYLKNELKLLLGQGYVGDSGEKTLPDWQKNDPPTDGWHEANGSWTSAASVGWKCGMAHGKNVTYIPCLFNETDDIREKTDLSTMLGAGKTVQELRAKLTAEVATSFSARSPAKMMGHCDQECATKYWKSLGGSGEGPICGVPGC